MNDLNNDLINAVEAGNLIDVKSAIGKGADINYIDKYKTPVLMLAVMKGHYEIVKYLLSKGADINFIYGKDKVNLLHIAIEHKGRFYHSTDILELLIEAGININCQDRYGNVPLHVACRTYAINSDVILILMKQGADMDIKNNYGLSPYSMAVENNMHELQQLLESFR